MLRFADSLRPAWQFVLNQLSRRPRRVCRARPMRCTRLWLEDLEYRPGPAVFTVTNGGPPTPDEDSFSLYDVVRIAETSALFGPSTIHFDPGLGGNVGLAYGNLDFTAGDPVTVDGGAERIDLFAMFGPNNRAWEIHIDAGASITFRNVDFGTLNSHILNEGQTTFENCTFSGGFSISGGVIDNTSSGSVTMIDCTMTGNSSPDVGGAIYNDSG